MEQIDCYWRLARVGVAIGLVGPLFAQGILEPGTRVPATSAPIALEGSVWLPDGAPAEGAVVVSSAGGRAVVDFAGRYRLETSAPPEAERLQVTAVAAAVTNLTASTSVELAATAGFAEVEPLNLTSGLGCQPEWLPTFGGTAGTGPLVYALAVFDAGGGPALYAGGSFSRAGGVDAHTIAKWNGSSWAPLGSGMNSDVYALTVHDDGSGPSLYAGGRFTTAGGMSANHIAKWNGSSWTALGTGMDARVLCLAALDDGSGPALYAGGLFTTAGGVPANYIAKWNGSSWAPLGSGMNEGVGVLAVHDDGSGPALYAGGRFTNAGGVPANCIAKWNGSSWAPLGSGMNNRVHSLTTYNDGLGPALYAGGEFTTAGGVTVNYIAKWIGSSWAPLRSGTRVGVNGTVRALTTYDDGSGPALYAGGNFTAAGGRATNYIAKWNGWSWRPLGSGMSRGVLALTTYDDGLGPALYAGGEFTTAGGVPANLIAKWNGSSWAPLGSGMSDPVYALTVHDDGSGPALYAGGRLTTAGGMSANHIAKWNGSSWAPLGSGVGHHPAEAFHSVWALTTYDDGSGPALHAGGDFVVSPGGDSFLAKWGCPAAACTTYLLDFQTEDDLETPLGNGQVIDSEFGRLVVISSSGANAGPAIFDTTPGGPNDPALNDDMLIGHGNVLLLEDDWYGWARSVPGFFDVVTDDPQGGDLVLDFTAPVDPRSMLLADINPPPNQGASVTLLDEGGRTRVYDVEPGWTGTYGNAGPHRLDLTTLAPQAGNGTPRLATATEIPGFLQGRVVRIVVHLTGFGALDELEFCR